MRKILAVSILADVALIFLTLYYIAGAVYLGSVVLGVTQGVVMMVQIGVIVAAIMAIIWRRISAYGVASLVLGVVSALVVGVAFVAWLIMICSGVLMT